MTLGWCSEYLSSWNLEIEGTCGILEKDVGKPIIYKCIPGMCPFSNYTCVLFVQSPDGCAFLDLDHSRHHAIWLHCILFEIAAIRLFDILINKYLKNK